MTYLLETCLRMPVHILLFCVAVLEEAESTRKGDRRSEIGIEAVLSQTRHQQG